MIPWREQINLRRSPVSPTSLSLPADGVGPGTSPGSGVVPVPWIGGQSVWVHRTGSVQAGWGCPSGNGQSVWVRQIGSDPPPEAPSPAPGNASSPAPTWLSVSPPPLWMNPDPGNKWE